MKSFLFNKTKINSENNELAFFEKEILCPKKENVEKDPYQRKIRFNNGLNKLSLGITSKKSNSLKGKMIKLNLLWNKKTKAYIGFCIYHVRDTITIRIPYSREYIDYTHNISNPKITEIVILK